MQGVFFFYIITAIAVVSFYNTAALQLSIAARFEGRRVNFFDEHGVNNCSISINNSAEEVADLVYIWKNLRGYYIASNYGNHILKCAGVSANLYIKQQIFDAATAAHIAPIEFEVFNSTHLIPEDWGYVDVRVREAIDRNKFLAFYEKDNAQTNLTVATANAVVAAEIDAGRDQLDIFVERSLVPVSPALLPNKTDVTPQLVRTQAEAWDWNIATPLLDGAMGWMKAFNFSAKERLCGQGTSVHFFDDGYHLQHEDLQNPRIRVRTQIAACNTFDKGCDHGTPSLGLLAAMKNAIGIEGLARCADSINLYSYTYPMTDVLNFARVGDIYGVNAQFCIGSCATMYPWVCAQPNLVKMLTQAGIIVIQAADNTLLDLNDFAICKNQEGEQFGFVVSASIRSSTRSRNLGISQSGIGWITNYNHLNSYLNGWGSEVVTTFASSGDELFLGRNRGYGNFGGTSSATPLTAGAMTVLQGYMKSRCPNIHLTFQDIIEILQETGGAQQLEFGMGYTININAALEYIDRIFARTCVYEEEAYVASYDDLFDAWVEIETPNPAYKCSANNVPFIKNPNYIDEQMLMNWTRGRRADLVICQRDFEWNSASYYLPAVSRDTYKQLKGTTFTFIRESTYAFDIYKTFGYGQWPLQRYQQITFQMI